MHNEPRPVPKLDVVCAGAALEMGHAQGTALKARIQSARDELRHLEAFRLEQPRWMPYSCFRALAERKVSRLVAPGVIAAFPDMHARLQGIAEGAGISLRSLYLFIGLEALMASVNGRITIPALAAACSAVAVRGRRSADGQPVIARNFDYLPVVQPFYSLRESRPTGGMRSLEFITAPMAGTIDGVNEAGLCITYNYAFTIDRPDRPAGMISMAISEALARCRTVSEAADWITSRPRWGGGLLMLADASGDIASLELSSTRSKLRRPDGDADMIYHTNCFGAGEMCEVQVPATAVFTDRMPTPLRGRRVLQSADRRRQQFERLLSTCTKFDSEQLRQILGNHGSTGQPSDDSLCMHGSYWTTTASLQLSPARRSMKVAYSSTCEANYAEFALN
jgi:Acyl-coenzyme A:6-aminopenicillanic acid acyl-transferase